MYEYFVQIEVLSGTEKMLQDPKLARIDEPNIATTRRFLSIEKGVPASVKNERCIVVLKMESLHEG